ncbi:MAG: hypothetical protein ACI83D_000704 [Planctomycetota bacterium]|jgi:hypothetical protein
MSSAIIEIQGPARLEWGSRECDQIRIHGDEGLVHESDRILATNTWPQSESSVAICICSPD